MRWPNWLFGVTASFAVLLPGEPSADDLRIFTEELPPLNYTDNGRLTGLSVEIVRDIMRRTGGHDNVQLVPWARGYRAALEEPNVVLFSTTRTAEREDQFKWVGPLAPLSYVFYKRRGSPITLRTLDDARRVGSIATYRDDAREQFLREHGFTNLDSSPKLASCPRKLLEGRVDLWLDSNLTARQVVRRIGEDPERIEPVLTVKTNYLYVAFSKQTDDDIVERWRAALDAMRRDGTFRRIYRNWLPGQDPPPATAMSAATSAALSKLRIVTEELPPLNYTENGSPTGLSTRIVRAIMKRLGLSQPIEVMPWARAYKVARENPNVALFSTVRSKGREGLFHWVGPLGTSANALYARRGFDLQLKTLDDARRLESIGTYKDDTDEQFLRERHFTNLYSHSSPDAIVRNLMAGRIQAWAAGTLYAPIVMEKAGYDIGAITPVLKLRESEFYIAFSRDTPRELVELWQATFDELVSEGVVTPVLAMIP